MTTKYTIENNGSWGDKDNWITAVPKKRIKVCGRVIFDLSNMMFGYMYYDFFTIQIYFMFWMFEICIYRETDFVYGNNWICGNNNEI